MRYLLTVALRLVTLLQIAADRGAQGIASTLQAARQGCVRKICDRR